MRIDLLLVDHKCYSYETYIAGKVCHQFECFSIPYKKIYLSESSLQDYLLFLQDSPPTWALSLTEEAAYRLPLHELLGIPLFLWLESIPSQENYFVTSSDSQKVKIGIGYDILYQTAALPNLYFLPWGSDQELPSEKEFDLVLFADLIALSFFEQMWKKRALTLPRIYHAHSLMLQKTVQQVTHFKICDLHIFGEHAGAPWLLQLPENIHLHTRLPFSEQMATLKMSKMVLAEPNTPWYFMGCALGCLPITDEQEAEYYLKFPKEREKHLNEMQKEHLLYSWEEQVTQLLRIMDR